MYLGGMSPRVDVAPTTASIKLKIKNQGHPSTKSEYVAIAKFEQEAHPKVGQG